MSERGITGARACQQWEVIQKSFERISRGIVEYYGEEWSMVKIPL